MATLLPPQAPIVTILKAFVIFIGTTVKYFCKTGHDHCFSSTVLTFDLLHLSRCNVCGQTKQELHCTYKRDTEARSRNHCYRGKAIWFTYSECVSVVLIIQHSTCVRRIMLIYVACGLYHFFPNNLIIGRIFEKKKVFEHKIRVLILSTTFFLKHFSF